MSTQTALAGTVWVHAAEAPAQPAEIAASEVSTKGPAWAGPRPAALIRAEGRYWAEPPVADRSIGLGVAVGVPNSGRGGTGSVIARRR